MKKFHPLAYFAPGRVLAIGAMLCAAAPFASFAKPAVKTPITVIQPDGSELTILLRGDEKCHFTYSLDGCLLMEDPSLGYVYADINKDGDMVSSGMMARNSNLRSATESAFLSRISNDMIGKAVERRAKEAALSRKNAETRGLGRFTSTFPVKGEQKALVILVEFQDVKFGSKNGTGKNYDQYGDGTAHSYWTDMLNKEGFDGFGAMGSCRDFFVQNSRDNEGNPQFEPYFDLFGPVTLPEKMSYYGGNDLYGNDKNAHLMVTDACDLLDDEITFSDYDRDGDGKVDNIYVFYAGFGEADGGGKTSVWPHSWSLSNAGMAPVYDGVVIDGYGCSNETDYQYRRPDGVGTFIHEFSHVMGLPDLYATSYTYSYTPGEYSALDYGPYNNEGRTPPAYSAYERYALEWMEPAEIKEEGEYSLDNLFDSNKAIIVRTEKDNEFFLAECRQQSGWDEYIPGHGMLIWHVDYVASIFNRNQVNNNPSHQYVDLIEANGRESSSVAAGHPFPGTAGVRSYDFKAWSKKSTGVSFSEIEEDPESGRITFHAVNSNYTPDGIDDIISGMDDSNNGEAQFFNLQGMPVTNPEPGQLLIRRVGGVSEKIIF